MDSSSDRYSRSSRGHSIVVQKFHCLNPANIKCIQITYKKAHSRALSNASTAVKKLLSCTACANWSRVRPYLSTNIITVFDHMTAFYFFHQSITSHSAWKWDTTESSTNTAPASQIWCFLTFKCLTMQVWCFLIRIFICNFTPALLLPSRYFQENIIRYTKSIIQWSFYNILAYSMPTAL